MSSGNRLFRFLLRTTRFRRHWSVVGLAVVLLLSLFGSMASLGAPTEQAQSPPAAVKVSPDALTAAERLKLGQASQAMERKCLSERREAFDVAERTAPGSGPLFSGEFYTKRCSCLAAEFAARTTPALYRRGTAQQATVFIRAIEDECTGRELKKALLGGSCTGFRSFLRGNVLPENEWAIFCGCAQGSFDQLEGEAFLTAITQLGIEMREALNGTLKGIKSPLPSFAACMSQLDGK